MQSSDNPFSAGLMQIVLIVLCILYLVGANRDSPLPDTGSMRKSYSDNPSPSRVEQGRDTLELAAEDVRRLIDQQQKERQFLINQLNILFLTNSTLLTFVAISGVFVGSFRIIEILVLLVNYLLLFSAFLPSQVSVSPNLEDDAFLVNYLKFEPDEYQFQMLYDLKESYNQNKKRLDYIAQSLLWARLVFGLVVALPILYLLVSYFIPEWVKLKTLEEAFINIKSYWTTFIKSYSGSHWFP
ncbi:MAG: hypothetical protein F6J93_24195 [Oscillatoria sp. SIO1A7]|nr:hypothetical protein [Oscillatoria sp. SIO1A7]